MAEKKDVFANIAAQRTDSNDKGLIEPQPPKLTNVVLPVGAPTKATAFRRINKLDSAEKLTKELNKQRRAHAKFMQDLAPTLKSKRISLPLQTFNWRQETDADQKDFTHTLAGKGKWKKVVIPHYGPPLGRAVTYYRTHFTVTNAMMKKGALFACFKGVDYAADVFVNGSLVGSHEGFFAPFECDFTAHAHIGRNTLLVKVSNDAICMGNDSWGDDGHLYEGDKIYAATGPGYDDPAVGWHHCPPGMGIYQDVTVEARSPIHIHDIFVRPMLDSNSAEVWLEVFNCDILRRKAAIELSVFGQNFKTAVCRNIQMDMPDEIGPGVNFLRFSIDMPNPRLWCCDEPWLYQLQATVTTPKGKVIDTAAKQFGMRSFSMDTDSTPKGMLSLNGSPIRLRGTNTMGNFQQCVMKKDFDQLRDDILIAKITNMNYLRLTQRPVQPEIYDYCDRLGIMTQTDLPLFGMLRRNQFCETVRQAQEMERLVRSHPCNIMVTYINEPFPNAQDKPHRHLVRTELEDFFAAASLAVKQANPDRVIKPVDGDYDPPADSLPDNHCYNGWYNSHGLPLGKLHKGYWQKIKPGWLFGCGEFGAEGLDPIEIMREEYPKSWLPQTKAQEADWSPEDIVKSQSGHFHYIWFDTQKTVANWISASLAHQADMTKLMTEAFRRDSRMVSFAIHLFIDAFPSGWMKTILDCRRQPKPAWFVYRDLLSPLITSLRCDRRAFTAGEEMKIEAWVCNDLNSIPHGATLKYQMEVGGKVVNAGHTKANVQTCDSTFQGFIPFKAPDVAKRGKCIIRLAIVDAEGKTLHDTELALDVFPQTNTDCNRRAFIVGARAGKAETLAKSLGMKCAFAGKPRAADCILIDDMKAFARQRSEITSAVRAGARAIFLQLDPGEYSIADQKIEFSETGMGKFEFVSRDTGHPLVDGFDPHDFKFWYDATLGYRSPILSATFNAKGWTPILKSGNGAWGKPWNPVTACGIKAEGQGQWCICQLHLAGRIEGNPPAKLFARRLLCR